MERLRCRPIVNTGEEGEGKKEKGREGERGE